MGAGYDSAVSGRESPAGGQDKGSQTPAFAALGDVHEQTEERPGVGRVSGRERAVAAYTLRSIPLRKVGSVRQQIAKAHSAPRQLEQMDEQQLPGDDRERRPYRRPVRLQLLVWQPAQQHLRDPADGRGQRQRDGDERGGWRDSEPPAGGDQDGGGADSGRDRGAGSLQQPPGEARRAEKPHCQTGGGPGQQHGRMLAERREDAGPACFRVGNRPGDRQIGISKHSGQDSPDGNKQDDADIMFRQHIAPHLWSSDKASECRSSLVQQKKVRAKPRHA